jgi:hypothetical protein
MTDMKWKAVGLDTALERVAPVISGNRSKVDENGGIPLDVRIQLGEATHRRECQRNIGC